MKNMNPAAKELNTAIQNDNPAILSILSDRAQAIFFPKSGIMAQTADAKGKKFNATIGIAKEEDGTPMRLQSIDKHIDLDPIDVYPYANSYGKLEIRELWQAMMKAKNPSIQSRISLPVVTPGLTHGLSTAAYLLLNPGETMLVTDKYWGNYRLTYSNCFGVNIKPFNTFKEGGFDCEAMREALFDGVIGKKVLLLNFPNNPSGYTPTDPEVDQIITIIKDYADAGGLLSVIVDDAYFGLIYEEGVYRESIFGKLADLHENVLAVKIDGATKEDYVWGYRVGFITFATKDMTEATADALAAKAAGFVRGSVSNTSHLSQSLLLSAYHSGSYEKEKKEKLAILQARYKRVKEVLDNSSYKDYFTPLPFNSGYFMCLELKEGLEGEEVRKVLLEKFDTGVISMGNLIRIAFSSIPLSDIESLFKNIYEACRLCSPQSNVSSVTSQEAVA